LHFARQEKSLVTTSPRSPQLGRLHALRGLAALLVLGLHVSLWDSRHGAPVMPPGPGLGWVGVDIFFVLSGFIIVYATTGLKPGLGSAAGFAIQRAGRVFPAYWAVLGAVLAVAALAPGLAGEGAKAVLWADALLLPSAAQMHVTPAWTLVHEIHFYSVFALLLVLARARLAPALIMWAATIAVGALLPELPQWPYLQLALNPLNLMFLMGAGVALALERGVRFPARFAAACGLVALVGGTLAVHALGWKDGAFGEWARALCCGLPAAVLIAGLAQRDQDSAWTPPAPLARLGDWSYALYLINLPLIYVVGGLVAGPDGAPAAKVSALIAATILSFVLAIALHHLIERPWQAGSKRLARAVTTPPPQPAARGWQAG
jgi:exopolysaccharide production protein ExoZ